jgi:DNA-binding protein H-NS
MSKPTTQAERLTRIETLLEAMVESRSEERAAMAKVIEEMAADIKQIKSDVAQDKADLAALKNKGVGLLVGAALAGGGVATGIGHFIGWFSK